MGMVLITTGNYTKKGYLLRNTKQKIYSIEELCHCIMKNPEFCEDYLYDKELANFIKEDLCLNERGLLLENLIEQKAPLKDLMSVCLHSCNYSTKEEISSFLKEQVRIEKGELWVRAKKKADSYLFYENYRDAIAIYQSLLKEKDVYSMTSETLGDIYHNLAISLLHTEGFAVATDYFREAYERNNREESLKQYLLALYFSKDMVMYEAALNIYHVSEKEKRWLNAVFTQTERETYEISDFNELNLLRNLWKDDKINEFYTLALQMIEQMKEQYRNYNE